jgi:hypothetical protein
LTKRLAIIGAVLSAIVFVTTLAQPNIQSEWPPLIQAAARAAGVFLVVWLLVPVVAYLGYLVLTPVPKALQRSSGPDG